MSTQARCPYKWMTFLASGLRGLQKSSGGQVKMKLFKNFIKDPALSKMAPQNILFWTTPIKGSPLLALKQNLKKLQ